MSGEKRKMSWRGWLLLVFGLGSMLVMWTTTALLFVGLLPTLVAFVSSRDREKSATLSMGPLNLWGVMPFVVMLWRNGHDWQGLLAIVTQPLNLVLMYGASAIGWAIYRIVPVLVVAVVARQAEVALRAQEEYLATLREMWGEEISAD